MPEFATRPIPAGMESYFREHTEVAQNGECLNWLGPKMLATGSSGTEMPAIVWGDRIWKTANVAWAVKNRADYPLTWHQNRCYNKECVNADHIKIISPKRAGRVKLSLEQTASYAERKKLIKEWLSEDNYMVLFEIISRLQERGLGGKTTTISAIVRQVRAELFLPARVPSRRKKEPSNV